MPPPLACVTPASFQGATSYFGTSAYSPTRTIAYQGFAEDGRPAPFASCQACAARLLAPHHGRRWFSRQIISRSLCRRAPADVSRRRFSRGEEQRQVTVVMIVELCTTRYVIKGANSKFDKNMSSRCKASYLKAHRVVYFGSLVHRVSPTMCGSKLFAWNREAVSPLSFCQAAECLWNSEPTSLMLDPQATPVLRHYLLLFYSREPCGSASR